MVDAEVEGNRRAEAPVPSTFKEYALSVGPGLVAALAWLSAGDLISSSVAGSTYGYALLWAFVLSLLCRYFFVSAIGKYVLCNNEDSDSILAGFGRLWKGLPLIIAVVGCIGGFISQTYIIKGAATAVYRLTGSIGDEGWGIFICALLVVGITILLLFRGSQYAMLERIAQVSCVLLVLTFLAAVAIHGVDFPALVKGLVFNVPADTGGFSVVLTVGAIIGAVAGSNANLLYPYFMQDKGWRGPAYRKLQLVDLLVGIMAIVVINLCVWIVAAETLFGGGFPIETAEDLAAMMGRGVGAVGPILLWIGLFLVTFNSFPAFSYGYAKIFVDGMQRTLPGQVETHERPEDHRAFKWIQIGPFLLVPLLFSLPAAPNFVALTIVGNALQALIGPIIIVGVILLTASSRYMLPRYANKWWETAGLMVVGGIGLWAIYGVLRDLLF